MGPWLPAFPRRSSRFAPSAPQSRPGGPMTTITPSTGTAYAGILGIGSYRPRRVVPNSEILEQIDSSDEWIQTRSGHQGTALGQRRRVRADDGDAGGQGRAGRVRDRRRRRSAAVIVATVTHAAPDPAAATQVAVGVGSPTAAAFDISAACAGFCYAIAIANGPGPRRQCAYVLVIGVERAQRHPDPTDRGTAFIFADGAGAAWWARPTSRASARSRGVPTARSRTVISQEESGRRRPRATSGRPRGWTATRCSGGRRSRWRSRTARPSTWPA